MDQRNSFSVPPMQRTPGWAGPWGTVWNSDNLLLVPVSSAESIHSLLSIVLHYLGFNLPSIPFKPSHNVLGNDNDNVGLFERGRSTTHTVPEI